MKPTNMTPSAEHDQTCSPAAGGQPASTTALRVALLIHAVLAAAFGIQAWKITLGFSVMGAESISDFYPIHIFYLVVFGPTPVLNLLAAIHLSSRPVRANRYLVPALVFAWIQTVIMLLFAIIVATTAGFVVPLFFAILFALLVGIVTRAKTRYRAGSEQQRLGSWRTAALDIAVVVLVSVVLAIPVVLFNNQYAVF
jgi:hypothetical protein